MKFILAVLILLIVSVCVSAQPSTQQRVIFTTSNPPTDCNPGFVYTNQSLNPAQQWVGTSTRACSAVNVGGSGGISNSAGANVIMKSNGANAIASTASDDGTTFSITAALSSANATTPTISTAAGKTNTGSITINGKTSGGLKLTTADATAQTVTLSAAAQTGGATTVTIPDQAGSNRSFVFDSLTQTLSNKSISGAINTLINIGNGSLVNSSMTIAGSAVALGGSLPLDTITGVSSVGMLKRTGANTLIASTISTCGDSTHGLSYDGTNFGCQAIAGSGAPGGSNTQVQFNNSSVMGGITNATTDGTTLTLTSPKIVTQINDTNANSLLKVTATGSAVNQFTVANAASGSSPVLSATGTDTDLNVILTPKGAGTVNITGTTSGDIALSGSSSGTTHISVPAAAGSVTFLLPTADGSNGQCMITNGVGQLSFTACGSGGTPGGSNTQLQYNNSSSFGGISGATTNGTSVTFGTGNIILSGYTDWTRITAPANPSAGSLRLFANNSTGVLACLDSSGANCMPGGVSGLTTSKIPKASSSTSLADSRITDDGTNPISSSASIGVGASPDVGFGEVAAGVALITDGAADNSVSWGMLRFGRDVIAKTADYAVDKLDQNRFFTNTGAGAGITFTLPTPVVGMTYEFYRDTNQTVTVDIAGSVVIRVGASATTSGGNVTLDAVGSRIRLVAISTTLWVGDLTGAATFN